MEFSNIELHDALIDKIEIALGKISVFIQYYPDEKSRSREPIVLEFIDVQESNLLMNHLSLFDHEFAGNISYWIPNENGLTYIYLARGLISIKSKTLNILFSESAQ